MAHILGPEIGQVVQLTRCGVLVPLSLFYQLHEQFVSVIEGWVCLVFFFLHCHLEEQGLVFLWATFISFQRILPLNPDWQAPLTWVTVWSSDDLRRLYVNKLEPHLTLLLLLLEPDFKAVCVCFCGPIMEQLTPGGADGSRRPLTAAALRRSRDTEEDRGLYWTVIICRRSWGDSEEKTQAFSSEFCSGVGDDDLQVVGGPTHTEKTSLSVWLTCYQGLHLHSVCLSLTTAALRSDLWQQK